MSAPIETKCCRICKAIKMVSEFYWRQSSNSPIGGRYTSDCKDCYKAAVRLNRLKKIDHYQHYDRNRKNRDLRRPKQRETKQQLNARFRAFLKLHPEVAIAQRAVQRAKKNGTLVPQPCTQCGADRVEAHHPDYLKPLEVVWLCKRCHGIEHRRLNELARQANTMKAQP